MKSRAITPAGQLDAAEKSTTLPIPMKFRVLPAVLAISFVVSGVDSMNAAVVFRPGAKAKYVPPGEEQLNGNAAELFEIAQKAEKDDNPKRAIRAYRELVRKYPHDALAAGAVYRGGVLYEQIREYLNAAATYRLLVTNYPTSLHFNDAIPA